MDTERMTPPADFQPYDQARVLVFEYVKDHLEKTDSHVSFGSRDVYVVWFAYILGGWKALVSTKLPDGMYYEVTHNREKNETYIDAYKKWDNVKITYTEFATPR